MGRACPRGTTSLSETRTVRTIFVCEIPKWTRKKYEIATGETMNPIKQDVKNGVLRDYKWGDMLFNYGAFPQDLGRSEAR